MKNIIYAIALVMGSFFNTASFAVTADTTQHCQYFSDFTVSFLENAAYAESKSGSYPKLASLSTIYVATAREFDTDIIGSISVNDDMKKNVRRIIATHQEYLVKYAYRLSKMSAEDVNRITQDICLQYEFNDGPNRL